MSRSSILDVFRQYIPQPKVETKEVEPTKGLICPSDYKEDVDDDDIEALEEVVEKEDVPEEPKEEEHEYQFVDLRKEPRTKDRGKPKGSRKWKNIKGITLHQTAADFGLNPMRLLNVPAHGGTLKDGKIVLLHDPTAYLWHGHALNKYDIGIEVSCRTAGIHGDPRTLWRSKKDKEKGRTYEQIVRDPTQIQLAATRELIRYYIKLVEENGGKILYIHAHRQGHKSRIGDPGSLIWQEVAIPIMEEFDLTCGPVGWKVGSGNPIPEIWDPVNGKGIPYNWKIKGF